MDWYGLLWSEMITFVSIARMNRDIANLAARVPPDVDVIVGIPRDGLLIATLLALRLDVALADISGFCEGRLLSDSWREPRTYSSCRSALVIDDVTKTGLSMSEARDRVIDAGITIPVRYTVLYCTDGDPVESLDIAPVKLGSPRCYEWRLTSHNLSMYAMDMDGVL